MTKTTLSEKLRYRFDNYMSKGPIALIGGLALVCLAFILLMAILVSLTNIMPEASDACGGQSQRSFPESVWDVVMHTIDTGTIAADKGWKFRIAMLIVTFVGIFGYTTLIGIISNGINAKVESLRRGSSRVIETNHIVILGWSFQVFTLISELILANAYRPDTCIVILSEEPKADMEDKLRDALGRNHRVHLVCRTGSPSNISHLGMVNIQASRSVVILNAQTEHHDAQIVKTLLAITSIPRAVPRPYHIVTAVQRSKNLDVIDVIGHENVETVLVHDVLSRIIVQTSRQSGLSIIYMDLLDFGGNEIHFTSSPSLEGKTYGQVLFAYKDSAVIGIKRGRKMLLNPPMDQRLQKNEQLILISIDERTVQLSGFALPPIDYGAIRFSERKQILSENTLILGWNKRIANIIHMIEHYIAPGSIITVAADCTETEIMAIESLNVKQQTVEYRQGDITNRQVLEDLNLTRYNHVIILSRTDIDPAIADANTLVTLLYLRDIANSCNHNFRIVTEIMDMENQALAQIARPDDFVLGKQIISLLLAQIAEHKDLNAVFAELFNAEGAEIYLRPVVDYIAIDLNVNFYTVVEAAKQRNESAIGYRRYVDMNNRAKSYGVVLNPPKDRLIRFEPQDTIIVFAERYTNVGETKPF